MNASPLIDSRMCFQQTAITFQGQFIEGISTVCFLRHATLAEILFVSEEQVMQQKKHF